MSFRSSPSSTPMSSRSSMVPLLPLEVVRRIIFHRLALDPAHPALADLEDQSILVAQRLRFETAGLSGRRTNLKRRQARQDVQAAALELMRVCKAWKSMALKYLYAHPHLSTQQFLLLCESVLRGDKKWDNLRLHPHSLPGRYVRTLDLSSLETGYFGPHITSLNRACLAVFPLLPNVQFLTLPGGIVPFSPGDLEVAPFCRSLRSLEGVQLGLGGWPEDRLMGTLRRMRSLEVLSVFGSGLSVAVDGSTALPPEEPAVPLNLPNLHTLTLDGVVSGPLISALTAGSLPRLRRLYITSYNKCVGDQTTELIAHHGRGLVSLTFLPTREWPTMTPAPPDDTLLMCPALRHLSLLLPHSALQKSTDFAANLARSARRHPEGGGHPFRSITLPKWTSTTRNTSPSPSPAVTPAITPALVHPTSPASYFPGPLAPPRSRPGAAFSPRRSNRFLAALLENPPPNLRQVVIDGFTWVAADLGRAALETGASGEMRLWSAHLKTRGITLLDGEGKESPNPAPATASISDGSKATRGMGMRIGYRMNAGGIGRGRTVSRDEVIWQDDARGESDDDGG